jgi:hypothetical protein
MLSAHSAFPEKEICPQNEATDFEKIKKAIWKKDRPRAPDAPNASGTMVGGWIAPQNQVREGREHIVASVR